MDNSIKNITQLRNDLVTAYQQLRAGAITNEHAKQVSSMAGKIINSLKVETNYDKIRQNDKDIKFLEKTNEDK